MALSLKERLQAALKQREVLSTRVATIRGRLEAATQDLVRVETECRSKGYDPDALDSVISQLQSDLESKLSDFESTLEKTEKSLSQFA